MSFNSNCKECGFPIAEHRVMGGYAYEAFIITPDPNFDVRKDMPCMLIESTSKSLTDIIGELRI